MKARETVLSILAEHGGSLDLTELGRELDKRSVLGFGVEIVDVVRALAVRGLVDYNRATEVVSLRPR